jgi:hypothetical protein
MIKNINTDLAAGAFGSVISVLFWFSIEADIMPLSIMFPRAMILIMALISMLLVIKGFITPVRRDLFDEGSNRRVVMTALFFFAWVIAISFLGFFVSSVLAISAMVYYLARARRRVALGVFAAWLAVVVGEVALFYLIFTRLLHVPLPKGLLF